MKYLKSFDTHDAYAAYIVGASFKNLKNDNVSYCKLQKDVHYNPYIPTPKFLDILYSDSEGNLSFTSEVLPVLEGKTPIGLCIASQGFFGENEKARWMSLKYMNCETPENGSLTSYIMRWGNYGIDISTIDNLETVYNGAFNAEYYYLTADWITGTDNKIPSLFDINDNWNTTILGAVNQYVITDIDGKNKTDKILVTATSQSTWQTDTIITNNSGEGYAPAVCCCTRYHTLGTQMGDWYLGACGEISIIVVKRNEINSKLNAINTIYPNDCMNLLNNNVYYWTSTEYSNNKAYRISTNFGMLHNSIKDDYNNVIALLQY